MVTEEELSQMSPEELAEFQKQNCVFCQIAKGKIPAKTVYSDDEAVAVLDIHPAAKGHILLMPKEHYSVMPQVPEYVLEHLFMVAKALSQSALKALKCRGTTIFVANGVAAGQRAPHFMIHIIPRNDQDGIPLEIPLRDVPKQEIDAVANVLKKALGVDAKVVRETKKPTAKATAKKSGKKKQAKAKSDKSADENKKFDLDSVTEMLG